MTKLSDSGYGKARVRLAHVVRGRERHDFKDLTLWIRFRGDYARAYIAGDNTNTLPTDTMKNTVYALAKQHPPQQTEIFGLTLGEHFLANNRDLEEVRIRIAERPWTRMEVGAKKHPHAFLPASEIRTAELTCSRNEVRIRAGIRNFALLKTQGSAFEGFLRDKYTTLPDTRDRVLSAVLKASWLYDDARADFDATWRGVRDALTSVFAAHESRSAQHTIYAMGEEVLRQFPGIREITIAWANKHNLLVDLSPFGLENRDEVFLPVDEPHGLIEATIARK
jgi:urate oxidase